MMTEEDIAVSTMVNNIFDEEKSRKNGKAIPVDDQSVDERDEDDSLASGSNDVNDDGDNDSIISRGDDSDISVAVIEHEDDDFSAEEEDDTKLQTNDVSVDLGEIGGMDITLDLLDETAEIHDPIIEHENIDPVVKDPAKMRMDFNETTLETAVGKGTRKKSIRLSKINVLAFKNLFLLARQKLEKLKLLDTRLAANERKDRERMIAVEVLEEVTGIQSDDEDELTKKGFAMFGF